MKERVACVHGYHQRLLKVSWCINVRASAVRQLIRLSTGECVHVQVSRAASLTLTVTTPKEKDHPENLPLSLDKGILHCLDQVSTYGNRKADFEANFLSFSYTH